jgi:hypothetical protein
MPVFAHIAGIPVEETLAAFGPVLAVTGGCWLAALRSRLRKREPESGGRRRVERGARR